jgi:hypothetical protein
MKINQGAVWGPSPISASRIWKIKQWSVHWTFQKILKASRGVVNLEPFLDVTTTLFLSKDWSQSWHLIRILKLIARRYMWNDLPSPVKGMNLMAHLQQFHLRKVNITNDWLFFFVQNLNTLLPFFDRRSYWKRDDASFAGWIRWEYMPIHFHLVNRPPK